MIFLATDVAAAQVHKSLYPAMFNVGVNTAPRDGSMTTITNKVTLCRKLTARRVRCSWVISSTLSDHSVIARCPGESEAVLLLEPYRHIEVYQYADTISRRRGLVH